MMNDREPIVVEKPTQITPLEAALNALNAEITSKHLHLEPAPWRALREYVAELEEENDALSAELAVVIFNLKLLFNADYESMEWNACYDRLMEYSDNDNFAALAPQELNE